MKLFTKAACFGISLLVIFTLGITVNTKVLSAANFCGIDEEPQFYFGIAYLKSLLGPVMGDPVECEHANPANGDALQHTTTGLAFYRKATNTPTFTDGWTHWAWTENGLVTWVGASVDPPNLTVSTSISDGLRVLVDWEREVPILIGINRLLRDMTSRIKFMDLSGDACFFGVEPLVFGRVSMGETLRDARFADNITIRRDGQPIFADAVRLSGDIHAQLAGTATSVGNCAMSSVIYAAPDADARRARLRALLPASAGASLIRDCVLYARLLAPDSYILRQSLVPIIARLHGAAPPKTWML